MKLMNNRYLNLTRKRNSKNTSANIRPASSFFLPRVVMPDS